MNKARIFISYRREDSQGSTGRLYDHLKTVFSPDEIFKDIDNIPIGVNFPDYIEETLKDCEIVIAVIGKKYTEKGEGGDRARIFNEDDWRWEPTELKSENEYAERSYNVMEILKETFQKLYKYVY